MSKKKAGQEYLRYEVITQKDDETDDVWLPIPPQLLGQLNWKEGDEITIALGEDGKFILSKK
jgi:hypothetical protein